MPKNKLNSIDEILAKSQKLTTYFGETGQTTRNLNRGVIELGEASKLLAQSSSREKNNLDAFRFLSQRNFDARKLYDDVNAVTVDTDEFYKRHHEPAADLDSYLAKHQDDVILGIIQDSNRIAEEDFRETQERWAADEWATAKGQFMESLGHRAYRWEGGMRSHTPTRGSGSRDHSAYEGGHSMTNYSVDATANNTGSSSVFNTPSKRFGSTQQQDVFGAHNMTPGSPFNMSSLMTRNPSVTNTPANLAIIQKSGFSYPTTPGSAAIADAVNRLRARPILSDFLSAHARVVRELHLLSHGKVTSNLAPCAELSEAISIPQHAPGNSLITDGLTKTDLVSYKALLDFLSKIVGEGGRSESITPGTFSSICFESGQAYANIQDQKRDKLSSGAKVFLESQIYEIWSRAVDAAVYDGELTIMPSTESTSRQQRLRSYVSYQYRIGTIPRDSCTVLSPSQPTLNIMQPMQSTPIVSRYTSEQLPPNATPLWAFIYHSLRVGDLSGAQSELNRCVSAGYREGEDIAAAALGALIKIHASTATELDRKAFTESMSQCRVVYEKEVYKQHEGVVDLYRVVVFNLLGLSDKDAVATSAIPGFTLEDFLWANLWFVQVTRLGDSSRAYNGETELFEVVQEYGGADYFDQDRSTPFKYATVLFCCQRYGDAIAHLWSANKTVPAVHLTVLCLHYGLILPHNTVSQNPAHPLVNGRMNATGCVDPTPAVILQVFLGTGIFGHYPEIATDYLISMDSNWLPHAQGLDDELKEVNKLKSQSACSSLLEAFILAQDKDSLSVVVGQPQDNVEGHISRGQARSPGRLDEYLTSTQVDLLLTRAAYNLLTQRRESEGAIYLYQLAGRYTDVLDELCNQLSAHLIPSSLSYVNTSTAAMGSQKQQYHQQQYNATQHAIRAHWHQLGESFVQKYFRGTNQSLIQYQLTQAGKQDLVDVLAVLVGLYAAVDSFEKRDCQAVLDQLDTLRVLPTNEQNLDVYTAVKPHLKRVIDDLIIIAAESSKALYQQVKSLKAVTSGTTIGALYKQTQSDQGLTEKDIRMQNLVSRVRGLVAFTNKIKARLNRQDTANIVARTEATFL